MAENSTLSPVSLTSYFDPVTDKPLQVDLYFYKANTLDLITVYTDSLLQVPHASPVPSGGSGRVPPVYVGELPAPGYRVRTFDQYGQLIEDLDGLPGAVLAGGGGGGGDPADPNAVLQTGDLIFSWTNATPRAGAVRGNGNTIGNPVSGASEMAHDDAHALFIKLWQQDVEHLLVVASGGTPSRGSSAQGDWDAGKTIALPDYRNRMIIGMDPVGATSSVNRLAGAILDAGSNAGIIGAHGGRPTHTITALQLPSHTHTLTDPGHLHSATNITHTHTLNLSLGAVGNHAHNVTTYDAGNHTHYYEAGDATYGTGGGYPGWSSTPGGKNTGAAGNHSHTGYTDAQGSHNHAISGTASTAGDLGITIGTSLTGITMSGYAGGSQAHPIVQPI